MDGFETNIEKLLRDDSFINFCLKRDEQDIAIWEAILLTQPEKRALISAANERLLLLMATVREGEKELAVQRLSNAIDQLAANSETAGSIKAGRNKAGNDKAGNDNAGRDKAGNDKAGSDHMDEDNADGSQIFSETAVSRRLSLLHNPWMRAAAIILISTGGWLSYIYSTRKINDTAGRTIIAGKGERKSFILPDGSQVILDGDSKLVLSDKFDSKNREIELTGEAYFDIRHNEGSPFIIHTSFMDVKVLGTTFNVRAYPDEATATTSLIKGRVAITLPGSISPEHVIELHPMQKIVVDRSNKIVSDTSQLVQSISHAKNNIHIDSIRKNTQLNLVTETAWTENRLAFNDEPMEMIARKLEKWFGITVELSNPNIKNLPFTGSFDNPDLVKVMEAMRITIPVLQYRIEGNKKLVLY
jgi:transmembrane sensor